MEAWMIRRRCSEQWEHLPHFQETPGPCSSYTHKQYTLKVSALTHTPVEKQQRDRIFHDALLVHVVDVKRAEPVDFDVPREVRNLVGARLGRPPVEAVFPTSNEPLDVSEGRTVVPSSPVELVWKTNEVKLPVEEIEVGVGYGNCERLLCHVDEGMAPGRVNID